MVKSEFYSHLCTIFASAKAKRLFKNKKMIRLFLISLLIIAVCMVLMSVTILIKKGGRFPNTHVCGNKHLRKRGITSAQTQDKQAQRENPMAVKESRRHETNMND